MYSNDACEGELKKYYNKQLYRKHLEELEKSSVHKEVEKVRSRRGEYKKDVEAVLHRYIYTHRQDGNSPDANGSAPGLRRQEASPSLQRPPGELLRRSPSRRRTRLPIKQSQGNGEFYAYSHNSVCAFIMGLRTVLRKRIYIASRTRG